MSDFIPKQIAPSHMGPFIKYVRKNIEIFDPPSLCVRQRTIENAPENNRCTQEINRKFTLPPLSMRTYLMNGPYVTFSQVASTDGAH